MYEEYKKHNKEYDRLKKISQIGGDKTDRVLKKIFEKDSVNTQPYQVNTLEEYKRLKKISQMGGDKTDSMLKKIFGKNHEKVYKFYASTRPYRVKTLEEYKLMKAKVGKYYQSISSDKQINTIIKQSEGKTFEYHGLLQLLTERVDIDDYNDAVKMIIDEESDTKIYDNLRKYMYKFKQKKTYKRKFLSIYKKRTREEAIVNLLLTWQSSPIRAKLPAYFDVNNTVYLDLGCANGWKTIKMGKGLGLDKENIYGADIDDWLNISKNRDKNIDKFNFIKLKKGKKFPIKTGKFNLITLLMVLHHVKNIDRYLREVNRIMKMNGLLVVREHDAFNDIDNMLIDIDHALYDRVYQNNSQLYLDTYYAKYFDWIERTVLFKYYGFKQVYGTILSDSIRNISNPTRTDLSVYYKYKDI
jgi:ubiquinone/menaquinone biosynthesis C-methylase UbiE